MVRNTGWNLCNMACYQSGSTASSVLGEWDPQSNSAGTEAEYVRFYIQCFVLSLIPCLMERVLLSRMEAKSQKDKQSSSAPTNEINPQLAHAGTPACSI